MLRHIQSCNARLQIRNATGHLITACPHRALLTLAVETSCDDTSVAILDKDDKTNTVKLHYHEKITANNLKFRGVHPLVSQHSHEQNLAHLISSALYRLPPVDPVHQTSTTPTTSPSHLALKNAPSTTTAVQKPDFISVTRGPGMRQSINTGLNTAKGLAAAWQVPLVGVNHMQAHALTPRLVSSMAAAAAAHASDPTPLACTPRFPFLSLLVSGGHSMLLRSESLVVHRTIAETADIAVGDTIDKMARDVLPAEVLEAAGSTMYGPALESFAFPDGERDYGYTPPAGRKEEVEPRVKGWGWSISPILAGSKELRFSFSGAGSAVRRIMDGVGEGRSVSVEERRVLAREAMRVVFEHLTSRVITALNQASKEEPGDGQEIDTLVVSGGVAANRYLKHILRANLDARGYSQIKLSFPPLSLCTDNAAMIGWAGIEMFEAGWTTNLSCHSIRKWSLDPQAEDGGILGVSDWQKA